LILIKKYKQIIEKPPKEPPQNPKDHPLPNPPGTDILQQREEITGKARWNGMADYFVQMEHITKTFPGVRALDDVSFDLRGGEVLALLGENGAGKSTLMKVLSGVYTRDSGTMRILGRQVGELTPKKAQEMGVAIIHQELNMCSHLTVAENIFLGCEKIKGGVLSNKEMNHEAELILKRLNINIDPEIPVG